MKKNNGQKLRVRSIERREKPDYLKRLRSSKWLQITNLNPKVSEEQLIQHIQQATNVEPEFTEIRRHLRSDYPCIADVEFAKMEDKFKVINKLKMTLFQGYKMWIQPRTEMIDERFPDLKGEKKEVNICHLPLDMKDPSEIEKLCAEHGKVENVDMYLTDKDGYFNRMATVIMSSCDEAAKVFDALEEIEMKDSTITTAYESAHVRDLGKKHWNYSHSMMSLLIFGFPMNTNKVDICEFVMQVVDERPLRIQMDVDKVWKSAMVKAQVIFSKNQLVAECIENLKGSSFRGMKLDLHMQHIDPKQNPIGTDKIKMENLASDVTEQMIANHLFKCSEIIHRPRKIGLRGNSQNKVAIVQLSSAEDAQKMRDNVCMTTLEGKKCWVELVMIKEDGSGNYISRYSALRGQSKGVRVQSTKLNVQKKFIKAQELKTAKKKIVGTKAQTKGGKLKSMLKKKRKKLIKKKGVKK